MQVVLAVPDGDLRLALELYLHEEPGVFVEAATADAASALAVLGQARPDLVILSWEPLDSDCLRLMQAAHARQIMADVIVLCRDEEASAAAQAAGANAVVSSWDPPALLSRLIRQMHAARRTKPGSRTGHGMTRAVT